MTLAHTYTCVTESKYHKTNLSLLLGRYVDVFFTLVFECWSHDTGQGSEFSNVEAQHFKDTALSNTPLTFFKPPQTSVLTFD